MTTAEVINGIRSGCNAGSILCVGGYDSKNSSILILVACGDCLQVTQVTIYVDGIARYTGTAAPYTFNWNTRKASLGSHTITAKAWDAGGNLAVSPGVTVITASGH